MMTLFTNSFSNQYPIVYFFTTYLHNEAAHPLPPPLDEEIDSDSAQTLRDNISLLCDNLGSGCGWPDVFAFSDVASTSSTTLTGLMGTTTTTATKTATTMSMAWTAATSTTSTTLTASIETTTTTTSTVTTTKAQIYANRDQKSVIPTWAIVLFMAANTPCEATFRGTSPIKN